MFAGKISSPVTREPRPNNNFTKYEQVIKKMWNSCNGINSFGLSFPETFSNCSNTIVFYKIANQKNESSAMLK